MRLWRRLQLPARERARTALNWMLLLKVLPTAPLPMPVSTGAAAPAVHHELACLQHRCGMIYRWSRLVKVCKSYCVCNKCRASCLHSNDSLHPCKGHSWGSECVACCIDVLKLLWVMLQARRRHL